MLTRSNKVTLNELKLIQLFQIGTKDAELLLLFSDALSFIINRLSLISNKHFLFS